MGGGVVFLDLGWLLGVFFSSSVDFGKLVKNSHVFTKQIILTSFHNFNNFITNRTRLSVPFSNWVNFKEKMDEVQSNFDFILSVRVSPTLPHSQTLPARTSSELLKLDISERGRECRPLNLHARALQKNGHWTARHVLCSCNTPLL